MFYKHWKKIALALASIFWAACEDSTSAEECLYGPPSYYGLPDEDTHGEGGGAKDSASTDSSATSSAEMAAASSSSEADGPAINVKDSLIDVIAKKDVDSNFVGPDSIIKEAIVCLYGVPDFKIVKIDSVLEIDTTSTADSSGILCYNDTAKNADGKEFNIIDCTDGNKYLRNPGDATSDGVKLPEGVEVFAPKAGSEKAPNCTSSQDICVERNPEKTIEQDSLAGCHPIIDCPEKPE